MSIPHIAKPQGGPAPPEKVARVVVMYPDPLICPFLLQWCHGFDLFGFSFDALSNHSIATSALHLIESRTPCNYDGVVLGLTDSPICEIPWQSWLSLWARDRSRAGDCGALVCVMDPFLPTGSNLPYVDMWRSFLNRLARRPGIRLRFSPLFPRAPGPGRRTLADYRYLFSEPGKTLLSP